MKLNIYLFYNRKIKAYERPSFQQDDPDEFVEHVHRDFLASPQDVQEKMKEIDIYHIGEYDDNLGKIYLGESNLILSCVNLEVPKDGN